MSGRLYTAMKFKFLIILPLFLLLNFCDEDGRIWMSIDPVQCLGNEWEQDWLEHTGNNYEVWTDLSEAEQLEIFKVFYEGQGVIIHELDVTYPYEDVCLACSCPRGDRIHILVDAGNLEQMLDWGFDLD